MSIVPQNEDVQNYTRAFLQTHRIARILKMSNFSKERGIPCVALFRFIFLLVFTGKNLYRTLQMTTTEGNPGKDAVYRFLNSARYNWRKFLLLLSASIIKDRVATLTSAERIKVLIIDDSLFSRNRSNVVELLARVYDHCEQKYRRGFRMLTVGWSDGVSFLPVAFSLLSSVKQDNRLCAMNEEIDKRTNGYKRRAESIKKATETMFDLLKQVKTSGIDAQYVLFDRWFSSPSVIMNVLKEKFHCICMLKDTKVSYGYRDSKMTLSKLYASVRKKRGRAKVLASVIVRLGVDEEGKVVEAKIVFVRDRRSRKWLAVLSTDTAMSDEDIITTYARRWDIEVFFKMAKSHLKLAREFMGRSYDAMMAHTTIVCCRYIMLALEKRESEDPRTIGMLFYVHCDELQGLGFIEAMLIVIEVLKDHLSRFLSLTPRRLEQFMANFMGALPLFLKAPLQISMCES